MRDKLKRFIRNKAAVLGLAVIGVTVVLALFAPWIAPYRPDVIHEGHFREPPFWMASGSANFLLGTDDVGRDLLSRLIHGARVSLGIGALVVCLASVCGTLLGLLAGFYGGKVDVLVMQVVDVLMSLPSVLLAIVVVAVLGPGLLNAVLAVSIVALPSFIRIVRAAVLEEKVKDYVAASRSFGASRRHQVFRVILPNCFTPLIVQATLGFSDGILNAAALGFLNLGAQAPTPEWGTMLSDSRGFIESSPWLVTMPGLCILTVVLAFNMLGDGLRDAIDPRMKR